MAFNRPKKKGKNMKTRTTITRKIISSAIFAVALAAWLPAYAQDQAQPMKPMKGGEHLMMLSQIKTQTQADNLTTNDVVVMVCPKCKTVFIEQATTEKGHINVMTPGTEHLCSGCNSTIKIVGVGKGAKTEVQHICAKCGGSAFCCAATPGNAQTEGMEPKQ
jgi:hypothetical protein